MNSPHPRVASHGPLAGGVVAFLAAGLCVAGGDEPPERFEVVRLRGADGPGGKPADLDRVAAVYRTASALVRAGITGMRARVEEARFGGHRSGLSGCRARAERVAPLAEPVPAAFRRHVLYFVRAPRGGGRPAILPEKLPEPSAVFVLEAATLADVGALAKTLGRRVTLASAEFARAMGVRCADARIEFSSDGRAARVQEELP